MARSQFIGKGKAFWVPDPTGAGTVVTITAPTAVQVNTGTDITKFFRRDGLKTPQSGNVMDTSDASSKQNSTDLGTYGGDKNTVSLYRDDVTANDTAWPLFAQGKRGFLVIFRFGTASATPAAADRCEVYQVGVVNRAMADVAENVPHYFSCDLSVQASNQDATLA